MINRTVKILLRICIRPPAVLNDPDRERGDSKSIYIRSSFPNLNPISVSDPFQKIPTSHTILTEDNKFLLREQSKPLHPNMLIYAGTQATSVGKRKN